MPNNPRNADQEYLQGPRIPGALRFNLDKVAEHDPAKNPLGLTHMLPSAETFREAVGTSHPLTSSPLLCFFYSPAHQSEHCDQLPSLHWLS